MAITQEIMSAVSCADCEDENCNDVFYFHSKCHPEIPTWGRYVHGVLELTCAECEDVIVRVAVATGLPGSM
jgi:hypothetical protein